MSTRSSLPLLVLLAAAAAYLAGCASLEGGGGLASFLGKDADEPWEIPAAAYPSQSLYRVRYEGPDGKAVGFKLTLYLVSEIQFRMHAADSLGRKVWELAVDADDRALWVDHRNHEYCQAQGAGRLALVPLAHLPLAALPKLLLGRLPADPAAELLRSAEALSYRDVRGQLWNGGLTDGHLDWWTLVEDGKAVTWWKEEEGESVFVNLPGRQRLTWRAVVHEPLARHPGAVKVPPKYREGVCETTLD